MKALFTLVVLASAFIAGAQTKYDSPYVYEGASYSFTIPEDFHFVDADSPEMSLYSVDPEIDMNADEPSADCIMIGVLPNDGDMTPTEMVEFLFMETSDEAGKITFDNYESSNGRPFTTASGVFGFVPESTINSHLAITNFHDVYILCMIINVEDGNERSDSDLYGVLDSFEEYDTDRENTFELYEDGDDWESEPYFDNAMYETHLDYTMIDFEATYDESEANHWEEEMGMDYPELLVAYVNIDQSKAQFKGGIKVFSGGPGENFRSDAAKLSAAQLVYEDHGLTEISNMTAVNGTSFTFARYDVAHTLKEYPKQHLYITHCRGDIVFVLAYQTAEADAAFESTLEDFVKSMVYYEEIEFEEE